MARGLTFPLVVATFLLAAGCVGPGGDPAADGLSDLSCADSCKDIIDGTVGNAYEHMVARSPANPEHLVVAEMEHFEDAGGCKHLDSKPLVSTDSGNTWHAGKLPVGLSTNPSNPQSAHMHVYDPGVLFLADGTVLFYGAATTFYYCPTSAATPFFMESADLVVYRSTDGGMTFTETIVLVDGHGAAAVGTGIDRPILTAVGDGTVLATWFQVTAPARPTPDRIISNGGLGVTDLMGARSTDGGETWGPARVIHPGNGGREWYSNAPSNMLPDGTLFVIPTHMSTGILHFTYSLDNGFSWRTRPLFEVGGFSFTYTTMAQVGGSAEILVGYSIGTLEKNKPMLARSSDGGLTWNHTDFGEALAGTATLRLGVAADDEGTIFAAWGRQPAQNVAQFRIASIGLDGTMNVKTVEDGLKGGFRGHYLGLVGLPRGAYLTWVTGDDPDPPTPMGVPAKPVYDLAGARWTVEEPTTEVV